MTFGQTIKVLRKEANMTQESLAELLSISPQAVSRWETDAAMPDISLLPPLANLFNVTTDYILGNEDIKAKHTFAAALPVVGNIIKMLAALSPQKQEQAASYIAFLAQDDKKA